jgi:anti-anti-sigma factor
VEVVVEIKEAGKEKNMKIIFLEGKMDAISAPEFEDKMGEWLEQGETSFIINLGEVNYMSSAGLRSILIVAKKLKEQDGKIIFVNLREEVQKIFRISGFSSMIPTYESLDAALEHI